MALSLSSPEHLVGGSPTRELEIELLLEGIYRRYGYDFRNYARASLQRRIKRALDQEGLGRVSALLDRVLHDPTAMARFVETVAVHTTSMFRDPEVYLALRNRVVSHLRTYPFLRIWVAGCSSGEELYSIAILLEEEGLYERCRIYATDISDGVLEKARRGIFPLSQMRDYTAAYQLAGGREDFSTYYLTDRAHAILRSHLRRNVVFSQHNLATDQVFNEFHLVLCRNVNIYFDDTLQGRVFDLIHESLARFGVLVLGRRESLRGNPRARAYEELGAGLRVFRKETP